MTSTIIATAMMAAAPAAAQFPTKPLRMVVPFPAGGATDTIARVIASPLSQVLGQQVIVDNKPGANGLLATQEVARAAPTGHTLLVSFTAATVANKLLMLKPPVDPLNDIVPIARLTGGGGNLVVVNPSLPVKNMRELIDYAKTHKDLSYASWGIGSGGHLAMESIKLQSGMQITHVPYKTVSQIPPDVISGVIPVATIDSATPVPHLKSGRLRAIATLSRTKLPLLPEVTSVVEQGFQLDAYPWYGFFGPKGMPRDLVERLNELLNRWMVTPEVATFFEQRQNQAAPKPATVAEFERLIQTDLVSWKKLIDQAGVKPE